MRVLFASVPSKETQTVATLLEQIFSQSVLLAHQVVAILDDTAVRLCELCGKIAQKCLLDDDQSSASPAVLSRGLSTAKAADRLPTRISIPTIPTKYATHRELEGIPLLTVADVHLVLLLSRSLTGAQRSMEACGGGELVQFQLPPMLVGTTCDINQMTPPPPSNQSLIASLIASPNTSFDISFRWFALYLTPHATYHAH